MLKATRFGFLTLLLLIALPLVGAQPDDWEVLLYDGAQVLVVTPAGVSETIALPTEATSSQNVAISPNRQYFAFVSSTTTSDGFFRTVNITNLETGECCLTPDSRFTQESTYIYVGPFSPDSTRLFVTATRWLPETESLESAFLIIDAATGEILQQTEPSLLWGVRGNSTLRPEWTTEGITLYPICVPCEGIFMGTAWRWNPDTGEAEPLETFYSVTGDRLAVTGEYIFAAANEAYPIPGNREFERNVIEYQTDDGNSQIIYYQPDGLAPRPTWGLDGAAYLLPVQGSAVIVNRRGMIESVELPAGIVPLAGTPDGWLLWSQSDGSLYHVTRWTDGLIHAEVIGSTSQSAQWPQVLERPALGASVADAAMQSAVR